MDGLFEIEFWVWMVMAATCFLTGWFVGKFMVRQVPWWRRLAQQVWDWYRRRRQRADEWRQSQNGRHRAHR